MKDIKLKTNIMCGSCIEKVTPVLNEEIGQGKWQVNTADPKKVLTVSAQDLSEEEVIKAVQKAGYKAEKV